METRPGLVVFGPERAGRAGAGRSARFAQPGFKGTPFYARIAEAYRDGAGMLLCARFLACAERRLAGARRPLLPRRAEGSQQPDGDARLGGFEGERTGIAGWLASPASMGSLDYVSPEATFVTAFVVKDPRVIVDQLVPVGERVLGTAQAPAERRRSQERSGGAAWAANSRSRSTVRSSRLPGSS